MLPIVSAEQTWHLLERQRVERNLSIARLIAAAGITVSGLVGLGFGLAPAVRLPVALVYLGYSIGLALELHTHRQHTKAFTLAVHFLDVVCPILFGNLLQDPSGSVVLIYLFAVGASAYRWGIWRAIATGLALVVLALLGVLARGEQLHSFDHWSFVPLIIMTSLFAGYWGEQRQRFRREEAALVGVLGILDRNIPVDEQITRLLEMLLQLFQASETSFQLDDSEKLEGTVWVVHRDNSRGLIRNTKKIPYGALSLEELMPAGSAARIVQHAPHFRVQILRRDGTTSKLLWNRSTDLAEICPDKVLVANFAVQTWRGFVTVRTPHRVRYGFEPLRILQRYTQKVIPLLYGAHLSEQMLANASALERARIGRELHDGVIQALFGLEMQMYLLRQHAAGDQYLRNELDEMQRLIHKQMIALRDMVHESKIVEVTPDKLIDFLGSSVTKFANDSWIAAHFRCELPHEHRVLLPQSSCRDLARIAHEAMVNVRKHSAAKAMLVKFTETETEIILSIEDDGHGVGFEGKMSLAEMDAAHLGPMAIKDLARGMGASLSIESYPWRGTQIEVTVPKEHHAVRAAS